MLKTTKVSLTLKNLFVADLLKTCITKRKNMNRQTMIVALLVLLVGCTHTRQFSNYDEINSLTKGKVATLKLSQKVFIPSKNKYGVIVKGRDIQITPDSTYWIEPRGGIKQVVSTSQVLQLVILNRRRGAWEGFRGFLVAGAVLGIMGFAEGDDTSGFFRLSAEQKFVIGNAMGIVCGVFVGLPIGAASGSKDVYILHNKDLISK